MSATATATATATTTTLVPLPLVPTTTSPTPSPKPASSSNDSTPWGWIIALIALALIAALIGLILSRRRKRARWLAWRQDAEGVVQSAFLAQGLLPPSGAAITDVAHWQSVRERVDQAAADLDAAAGRAPTTDAAGAAQHGGQALRELSFALESARLLATSASPPTAAQLAESEAATVARRSDLDAALTQLNQIVRGDRQ